MRRAALPAAPAPADFGRLHDNLIVFGRALRAHGFRVQPDRMILLARAIEAVGVSGRDDVRAAARCVLVRSREDAERFDAAFDAFVSAQRDDRAEDRVRERQRPDRGKPRDSAHGEPEASATSASRAPVATAADETSPGAPQDQFARIEGDRAFTYSFAEGIYHKDFTKLTQADLELAEQLTRRQAWDLGRRLTRRMRPGRGDGSLDPARTLRESLRRGGEIVSFQTRVRRMKQRDLVLLCDISGSMDRYSRLLLQFVHTVRHAVGNVEAFVFGTRLTRITRELRHRSIRDALDRVATSVSDWAGGTRIGESIRAFNQRWGRRVLGRGAVVVIVSDGWDRGDIDLLAAEMQRLQRSCYRLVWLNPLLGSAGYRPQTIGMKAALPYIDDFLPAHNLKNLVQLAEMLQRVERRRPERRRSVPA